MAKFQNKIQKNINKGFVDTKTDDTVKDQVIVYLKIIVGILIILVFMVLISNFITKENDLDDLTKITAGQVFTRKDESYYVLFYDEADILDSLKDNKNKVIYKVSLNEAINKNIISSVGNKKAATIDELQINGMTLMKIENGKNVEYIEGKDEIINYINQL